MGFFQTKKIEKISNDNSSDISKNTSHIVTETEKLPKTTIKTTKTTNNKTYKYDCSCCDYSTSDLSNYNKHISTRKHKIQVSMLGQTKENTHVCECGKKYISNSGLWKHQKHCGSQEEKPTSQHDEIEDMKNVMFELLKQNQEFQRQMLEVCKHGLHNTNSHNFSHNKTFNLHFFLNETCKDALNINEFVDNVQISLQDIENVGSLGYVEGISKIILKNLKQLDVTKRPIHCSDLKREIIHIKDNNVWEKEPEKLKRAIQTISNINIKKIPEWKTANPHYKDATNHLNDKYMKIVNESMGACDEYKDEKNYNKIMKIIAQETIIDK